MNTDAVSIPPAGGWIKKERLRIAVAGAPDSTPRKSQVTGMVPAPVGSVAINPTAREPASHAAGIAIGAAKIN